LQEKKTDYKMMKFTSVVLNTIILLILAVQAYAQTPTIQDCLGAIPICQPVYKEDKVANGMGNYPNEITRAISCLEDERNAIWYTFTVNNTGNFGFTLIPNDLEDDYDWALYDVTNATCEDIKTNPNLLVSCNAAGQQDQDRTCVGVTGATGSSPHRIQGAGCGAIIPTLRNGVSPLNAFVPVVRGNTYVLVVSNWSRSTNGYTIDFGVSAGIGIFDLEDPQVIEATFPEKCGDNGVSITFNENIQCSTVDKFNFVLNGPGGPYDVRLLSPVCELGGRYTRTFDLLIEPAIETSGKFTLSLDGDRATEVLDICNNPAFNTSFNFEVTINSELPLELGEDRSICPGTNVTLDASVAVANAQYLWSNGATSSSITVAEAGDYSVTVTAGCASGTDNVVVSVKEGNNLNVELGERITLCPNENITLNATNAGATYLWQDGSINSTFLVNRSGIYAVTVSNSCGSVSDQVEVVYTEQAILNLGEDVNLCQGEQKLLSANLDAASYRWQDGSTDSTFKVTQAGIYILEATTSCGVLRDTVRVEKTDLPSADLGSDQKLCEGNTLTLDATAILGTSYLWNNGNTTATLMVNNGGTYHVSLRNQCGTTSDTINIEMIPDFDVNLGSDKLLCEGKQLEILLALENVQLIWQDGQTNSFISITEAGTYWVQAKNECFTYTDSLEVTVDAAPIVDLGDDRLLCPDEIVLLDVNIQNGQYTWQDGSTDAVYTVQEGGMYMVTVTNACGSDSDMIQINTIAPLKLDLGKDTMLCIGEQFILDVSQNTEAQYFWQDGSSKSKLIVNQPGIYTVQVSNICQVLEDDIIFEACPSCEMYIPTAFSPNLDNENDVFVPFPTCAMYNYLLQVFDRWGTLVFQTTEPNIGWDGMIQNQKASNGVYIWKINYEVEEGHRKRVGFEIGEVNLLR